MAAKKAKSSTKPKGKSKHGGPRPNSGRKPSQVKALKAEVTGLAIESADAVDRALPAIKGRLIKCIENLTILADGGYSRDRVTREPSGMVMVKRPVMVPIVRTVYDEFDRQVEEFLRGDDGKPIMQPQTDDKGRPVYVEVPLYPNKPPGELVVVSHASEIAEPDRAANQYLIDRILGRPHTAEPSKLSETQSVLPSILEAALERAYGGDDEPETQQLAIEV